MRQVIFKRLNYTDDAHISSTVNRCIIELYRQHPSIQVVSVDIKQPDNFMLPTEVTIVYEQTCSPDELLFIQNKRDAVNLIAKVEDVFAKYSNVLNLSPEIGGDSDDRVNLVRQELDTLFSAYHEMFEAMAQSQTLSTEEATARSIYDYIINKEALSNVTVGDFLKIDKQIREFRHKMDYKTNLTS